MVALLSQNSLLYRKTEILLLQKVIKLYIASSEYSLCELNALKFPATAGITGFLCCLSVLWNMARGHLKPCPFSKTMEITTWPEPILKLVPTASVVSMLHSVTYIFFPKCWELFLLNAQYIYFCTLWKVMSISGVSFLTVIWIFLFSLFFRILEWDVSAHWVSQPPCQT